MEEESVAAHQKDLQSAPDLSPLLERLSVQPAHAMAPENEHEEEEDDEGSVIKPTKMKGSKSLFVVVIFHKCCLSL